MAANQKHGDSNRGNGNTAAPRRAPEWADGLKQLYDSVVEEDLPNAFKDLLDRLDGGDLACSNNDTGAPSHNSRDARR